VSYPIAMVLLAILASIVGGHVTGASVFWGALCGVSQAFGVWWFYAALGSGPISVVSPRTVWIASPSAETFPSAARTTRKPWRLPSV